MSHARRLLSLFPGRYEFYLLKYVPDKSPVRQKMLYASTVSTVKRVLGGGMCLLYTHFTSITISFVCGGHIRDNARRYQQPRICWLQKTPICSHPIDTSRRASKGGGSRQLHGRVGHLFQREQGVFVGGGGAGMGVHGVSFPVDPDVNECLADLKAGNLNYVQLVRVRKFFKISPFLSLSSQLIGCWYWGRKDCALRCPDDRYWRCLRAHPYFPAMLSLLCLETPARSSFSLLSALRLTILSIKDTHPH